MDFSALRNGNPGCPSDLTLDELQARELPAARQSEVEQHLRGCAACQQRTARRARGFDAWLDADPRRMLAAIRRGAGPPRRKWWLLAPALAGTLAVALWPHSEETRAKGSPALHVFRAAGEAKSGDLFRAGESLELRIDVPAVADVQVLGIDPRGKLYAIWPATGAERSAPGIGLRVPGALALDETEGSETFALVTCPPGALPACESDGALRPPRCAASCHVAPFVLQRAP